ncbi:helix-turn-helix domain-containing protein [Nonomuraea sp. NPDC051941]|uniref:helix-turn-helix domain-containing protein n=1 Tax=Nonomuraea sp. NPDC051941 TaxID=3364373 RepID=UPI0037CA88A8
MHDRTLRNRTLRLLEAGLSVGEASRQTGVSLSTIRRWREVPESRSPTARGCARCAPIPLSPHLFPQHGPGKKHERPIVLEPWQREIVSAHPGRFVRGLIHSDGWRGTNRVRRVLPSGVLLDLHVGPKY